MHAGHQGEWLVLGKEGGEQMKADLNAHYLRLNLYYRYYLG